MRQSASAHSPLRSSHEALQVRDDRIICRKQRAGIAATIVLVTGAVFMPVVPGTVPSALAIERGPVCREPSVVDEITREIRSQNYYSTVDPRLVTEQATNDPRIVRCEVCVQSTPFTVTGPDDRQIRQCLARGFEIRILTGGFVVRDLR